jgi:tetratricopeptide (TPR) repeat protein
MTAPDSTVLIALGISGLAITVSALTAISLRRQLAELRQQGRQIPAPVSAELSMVKHEFAMLSEMVHRFRAQSLAGIAENMKEKEDSIRQTLRGEVSREISAVTQEFDRALSSIVARVDQKQEQYASRLDELTFAQKPATDPSVNLEPKVNALAHSSVVNRFLSSLEDPADRRKCLLASIDSVHEVSTLGKLAVAYPAPNSWLILKELADHGVVSDVSGWALVAGAEMSFAAGDAQRAEELYQAARLSFSAIGGGMHGGLYIICTGLARVLAQGERAPLAEALRQEAQAHLQFLAETQPAELAITAVQLAEFYLGEARYECAAVLFRKILELAGQVYSEAFYQSEGCLRLWNGFGRALFVLTGERPDRDPFRFLDGETMDFLDKALTGNITLQRDYRDGLLLCMLRLAEREKEPPYALSAIKRLFDDSFSSPESEVVKARYEHLASEVLHTLDEMGLSRKKGGMPVLRRLVGIFSTMGNFAKAASAGAKLVDAALDIYGDASADTVAPIGLLADVYMAMERFDLCEECYRQILEMQYKIYPSEHEDMIETLLNLAHICRLQKDEGEAEIFLETAMEICTQVYGQQDGTEEENAERDRRRNAVMSRAEALKAELVS